MYGDYAEDATPRAIQRLLVDFGGLTPTGLPMWRFVRAGDCRVMVQGTIHHIPAGVQLDPDAQPERIQGGRFMLRRYPQHDGRKWILQKWFPPKYWGDAFEWQGHRADAEDTPLFAQSFPAAGDYFFIAGAWETPEQAGDLRASIRLYMRQMLENPVDVEACILAEMSMEVSERDRRLEELEREITLAEAALSPMLKSVSSDAQKMRDTFAADAGLSGHFGASEAWG
jgi:hypothetical protein